MIHKERMCAHLDGDFVVFLIGMRFNQWWKIHKWLPVFLAMPRMYKELYSKPELGFLHQETWFGRTIISVQYWRSLDQLMAYSKSKDSEHLPAWKAFNKRVGNNGSVGIWHETYVAKQGSYENIYANMPPFGLGKAGVLEKAHGKLESARDRLNNRN
ncbi:MAG: DUF4188 domain-containing protein [Burkholderiaceae bacterium]|nr:DUF4188 domain-containing protein [Burkholderiaceae bacterium]